MYFITFVFKNLFRRKFRTILTLIGVAVAVCTLVTFFGIADDFENSQLNTFQKSGADIVIVAENAPNQLTSELNEDIANTIQKIPGVSRVTPGLVELTSLTSQGSSIYAFIFGWKAENPAMSDFTILDGQRFKDNEHNVAFVGSHVASFLNKKVGDLVSIKHKDFKIVGIFRSPSVYENNSIIVPLQDLQTLFGHKKTVTAFTVTVEKPLPKPLSIDSIAANIRDLKDQKGKSLELSALPTGAYISQSAQIQMTNAMAWIISLIALILSVIGLANTMAMSVIERTREIGILRAIGWTKSKVVKMILTESLIVSIVGGICGIIGAIFLCHFLASLPQVGGFLQGNVSLLVIGESFIAAIIVGLIAGVWPALRASFLLPTEAIYHE